jgi:hypothetical protein
VTNEPVKLRPAGLLDCYLACKEFIRKCECGEARSKRSYAQMKEACEKAEKPSTRKGA